MATIYSNISTFSRFNLDESLSDIQIFIKQYRNRVNTQLQREIEKSPTPFISFNEYKLPTKCDEWLKDNHERFFKNSPNEILLKESFLSELGAITSMIYSPRGEFLVVGHCTGLIQPQGNKILWYPTFSRNKRSGRNFDWVHKNNDKFLRNTPNKVLYNRWYSTECGYITSLVFSPDGERIIVGHSDGLIQLRNGRTGTVLATLRNIQFPPKPIFALEYSKLEERVFYAACTDGTVYRIEFPNIELPPEDTEYCIRADPALEWLNTQFYGSPAGMSLNSTPYISQRTPALSLGITADNNKMIVGYGDTSVKLFDMETQEPEIIYKVHKLRLQFIPKKLQRVHFGQVVSVRCHNERPHFFATAAWDKTLRIWDTRCKVGCMMTFEGVDVCHDSIDLNRDECICGSWIPTEALTVWDLVARKRRNIIRVQNRRPDVDGEYIYACRYWRSSEFNRKGKYGIIGGSGTSAVEVINLHNRYITCSYPAAGTVLAVASHADRIAFGGTAPVFNIVSFHDPKHEPYIDDDEPPYNYTDHAVTLFERIADSTHSSVVNEMGEEEIPVIPAKSKLSTAVDISKEVKKKQRISTVAPRMSVHPTN